jgi:hypothetical protein
MNAFAPRTRAQGKPRTQGDTMNSILALQRLALSYHEEEVGMHTYSWATTNCPNPDDPPKCPELEGGSWTPNGGSEV